MVKSNNDVPILPKFQMFFCYILKSLRSSKYYIGSTENLDKRLKLHNTGKVRSTKSDMPWQRIYFESFESLSNARKRELQIKNWKSRKAIEHLISNSKI